jgi:hypothetical protein
MNVSVNPVSALIESCFSSFMVDKEAMDFVSCQINGLIIAVSTFSAAISVAAALIPPHFHFYYYTAVESHAQGAKKQGSI